MGALLVGTVGLFLWRTRFTWDEALRWAVVPALAMMAFLAFFALYAFPRLERFRPHKPMGLYVAERLPASLPVVAYRILPENFLFYARRRVLRFTSRDALLRYLRTVGEAVCLMEEADAQRLAPLLPMRRLARYRYFPGSEARFMKFLLALRHPSRLPYVVLVRVSWSRER
jgi:hypothetical protein